MKKSFVCVALAFIMSMPVVTVAVPVVNKIPYSRTTNLPYPASYTLRFSLWATASGGTAPVWSEEKVVKVTGKTLNTLLGSAMPLGSVSFKEQLWVQLDRKVGSSYVKIGGRTILSVVPYALWSASGPGGSAVPIGTIIDWWRPDDSWSVPEGYAICDGTVLDDPGSPLNGTRLPDLRSKYIIGTGDPATIGSTTGRDSHSHITNLSHDHDAFSTGSGGSHNHAWLKWFGGAATQFTTWDFSGLSLLATAWDNGIDSVGSGIYPLTVLDPALDRTWYTEYGTTHSHSVDPPSLGTLFRDSGGASSYPPSVLLLKIMRVR